MPSKPKSSRVKPTSSAAKVRMADTKATKAANANAPRYPRGMQGYGTTDKKSSNGSTSVRPGKDKNGMMLQVAIGSKSGIANARKSAASGLKGSKSSSKKVTPVKGSSAVMGGQSFGVYKKKSK